jgi:hypothetical protein
MRLDGKINFILHSNKTEFYKRMSLSSLKLHSVIIVSLQIAVKYCFINITFSLSLSFLDTRTLTHKHKTPIQTDQVSRQEKLREKSYRFIKPIQANVKSNSFEVKSESNYICLQFKMSHLKSRKQENSKTKEIEESKLEEIKESLPK